MEVKLVTSDKKGNSAVDGTASSAGGCWGVAKLTIWAN